MMNLLYILLLVLWSAFNSSDAWYYTEPPPTTAQPSRTVASSNPCRYWYNTPCYWTTIQPRNYKTQTQTPWWRRYYQMTTQSPSRRRLYYQRTTQTPWWRQYYQMTTQTPWWRQYYQMPTQSPSRRRLYYQRTTQSPSRRRLYYQRTTQTPWWRQYYQMTTSYWRIQDATVPSITVFRQMQDREHVIVMCSFGWRFIESSFQLSVKGEHNYTLKNPLCYSNEKCVFDVKVSSPVSFTCVHEINYAVNQQSETYTYSPSAQPTDMRTPDCQKQILDFYKEGVSLFYICFSSFIAVGLVIMTAAVIMTTIRSKAKDVDYIQQRAEVAVL